jgi:integrase/recombinase XerD
LSLRCFDEFIGAQGVSRLDRIDDARLRHYCQHLIAGRHNAPGTVGMRLRAVRRFLVFLADNAVVSPALAKGLGLPPLIPGLPRLVLSRKQVRAILAVPDLRTAKGIRNSAILETFYSTGMRLAEMTHLRVADVDLTQRVIHITTAKFSRDRIVPLGIIAAERLRQYVNQVRPAWVTTGAESIPALWLAGWPPHHPIAAPALARIVRCTARAAGIRSPVGPHVWRHTCATFLVRRGAPLPYVQLLLGHRSLNTTQLYARVAVCDLQRTFLRTHPRARERNLHVPAPVFDRGISPAP